MPSNTIHAQGRKEEAEVGGGGGDEGRNTSNTISSTGCISRGAKHECSGQGDGRRQEPSAGETCHETGCVSMPPVKGFACTILAPLESEAGQVPHGTRAPIHENSSVGRRREAASATSRTSPAMLPKKQFSSPEASPLLAAENAAHNIGNSSPQDLLPHTPAYDPTIESFGDHGLPGCNSSSPAGPPLDSVSAEVGAAVGASEPNAIDLDNGALVSPGMRGAEVGLRVEGAGVAPGLEVPEGLGV